MNRRLALGLVLLIAGAAGCEDDLLSQCGVPCFDPPERYRHQGVCRDGVTECTTDGTVTGCVGQVIPTDEVYCDGLDNNCDGITDPDPVPPLPCGNDVGTCTQGHLQCVAPGQVACVGSVGPTTEDCDDLDNNCNGIVDDVTLDLQNSFCWTHPYNDDAYRHAPCRAGVRACRAGAWVCTGEVWPAMQETCHDGVDDDCNGRIDDGANSPTKAPVDVVVIVDRSGSMECCRPQVQAALSAFINGPGADPARFRYWFIDLPGYGAGNDVPAMNINCSPPDLHPVPGCDATTAASTVGLLTHDYGGVELSWNAIHDAARSIPPLDIAWRTEPDTRRYIVFFGDESAHPALTTITERTAADAMVQRGIVFLGFIDMTGTYSNGSVPVYIRNDYDDLATRTGGQLASVHTPAAELLTLIETVGVNKCD